MEHAFTKLLQCETCNYNHIQSVFEAKEGDLGIVRKRELTQIWTCEQKTSPWWFTPLGQTLHEHTWWTLYIGYNLWFTDPDIDAYVCFTEIDVKLINTQPHREKTWYRLWWVTNGLSNISASANIGLLPWRCRVWVRQETCSLQPQEQRTVSEDLDVAMVSERVGLSMVKILLSPLLPWQSHYHFGIGRAMKGASHLLLDSPHHLSVMLQITTKTQPPTTDCPSHP